MKNSNAAILGSTLICIVAFGSGCGVSGPTYGTDKTTSEQLVDDFSNIVSLRKPNNNATLDTKPRPELVLPGGNDNKTLPVPQANVANTATPGWPESPEQMRKRLRDEATANQGNPNYKSPIISGQVNDTNSDYYDGLNGVHRRSVDQRKQQLQREDYLRRQKENAGGDATTRKYLSEPPLEYRRPAATAPVGDKGEDEAKKERERKKALKEASGKKSWWPF